MKKNTKIGKSKSGCIMIDFSGSNYSKGCYISISRNGRIVATYNRQIAGLMSKGMELGHNVRKATIQKWLDKELYDVKFHSFLAPMDILKNIFPKRAFDGPLSNNSEIIF